MKRQFQNRVKLSRGTRSQRFMQLPGRMICSKALQTIAKSFRTPIRKKVALFWGEEMIVVFPESYVTRDIFRYGFWEEGLTSMVLEFVGPGMVFLDVGAHFGYFSLLAARLVGETGQVHAFEPTEGSFAVLQENLRGKHNTYAQNVAVYAQDTTMSFYDYGLAASGFNSHYRSEAIEKTFRPRRYDVQAISLDSYTQKLGIRPDFIKIDAESAEYEILQGMQGVLKEVRPIISLEAADADRSGGVMSHELIEYMMERGYEPYEYTNGKIRKHSIRNHYEYENILFLPR